VSNIHEVHFATVVGIATAGEEFKRRGITKIDACNIIANVGKNGGIKCKRLIRVDYKYRARCTSNSKVIAITREPQHINGIAYKILTHILKTGT
jgi:hypothetical protein